MIDKQAETATSERANLDTLLLEQLEPVKKTALPSLAESIERIERVALGAPQTIEAAISVPTTSLLPSHAVSPASAAGLNHLTTSVGRGFPSDGGERVDAVSASALNAPQREFK